MFLLPCYLIYGLHEIIKTGKMKLSKVHTVRYQDTYSLDETLPFGHREPSPTLLTERQLNLTHRTKTVRNESNFTDKACC